MGGKDAPALTFPARAEMCSGFIGEHPQNSSIKECLGDGCKPSCWPLQLLSRAWQPAQPSPAQQLFSHCPTSQHQAPNPSLECPREHCWDFTPASDTELLSSSRAAEQTWLCRALAQAGLGAATSQFRGEPGCPVQRTQCTHADAPKVCLTTPDLL